MRNSKLTAVLALCILPAAFQNAKATPQSPGSQSVLKHGCANCHIIEGEGSVVAPPLDGIKDHRDKDYVLKKLTASKQSDKKLSYPVPEELMSHVHVSKKDAGIIADYLLSLTASNLEIAGHGKLVDEAPAGSHFVPQPASSSSARGLKLYTQKGCISCHAVGPTGGTLAPNLAGVGARRSRKYITGRIAEGAIILPKPEQPSGRYAMPPARLKPEELEDLTNWLLTLPPEKH